MRDLTFFTTSAIKLAQSRYLAEDFNVRIKGFRQRFYHADYHEPRLDSRKDILEQSYRSAVKQCEKAGLSIDSNAFFLEDTSVIIKALSKDGTERPGVDVKYWMKNKTFADLNAEISQGGGLRNVTVRSDVVLHIPRSLKRAWGTQEDYVVFVGEQSGVIVDREVQFEANMVYPWLDNKTFNKWFQPDGRSLPLGALSIESSRKVDFRVKSLTAMLSYLEARGFLNPDKVQMKLDLDIGKNLILCGYTCAGKTVASQELAMKYGYLHVEASDFMSLSYLYRHGYQGPISIGDFAEAALLQKPQIAAEQVVEYVKTQSHRPIIVSGFRSPLEVHHLKAAFEAEGRHFDVVFIEADEELRFQRINERRRPGDDIPLDKFRRRDAQQRRMGLDSIKLNSSTTVLANEDTFSKLISNLSSMVGSAVRNPLHVSESFKVLPHLNEVRLEDAILIALLSKWSNGEARPSFSTTEIAKIISSIFTGAPVKHKDNVSRYFNQDFYSYYEIFGEKGRRRYSLSNTGYGYALNVLREITFVPRNLQSLDD